MGLSEYIIYSNQFDFRQGDLASVKLRQASKWGARADAFSVGGRECAQRNINLKWGKYNCNLLGNLTKPS